jgi:3-deoxy-D-manno-octulosonic-acid transferase
LGVFFYNIFLLLLKASIHIVSLFNEKAKKWVQGRKDIFERLEASIVGNDPVVWMHCASLGEFEQGRPLIERLREHYPNHKFLLTFFSPSGYEVQKNYKGADWVFYLPIDSAVNARRFLEIVKPSLVIFVKYEFWYYYLKKIKYRQIPLLLVSALFRQDMSFFRWYGSLQRKMLSRFDHLFVQNKQSKILLDKIGLGHISSVSGDTRFDRVLEIAEKSTPIPMIDEFVNNQFAIVAGSTWKEDEELISRYIKDHPSNTFKWIIAPHEIDNSHLNALGDLFQDSTRFSELNHHSANFSKSVLIIDNIGMLARLYRYATITYIGGGFSKGGIHNILEAAVYGKPVLFGPNYERYYEAVQLIDQGGATSLPGYEDFVIHLNHIANTRELLIDMSERSGNYVLNGRGASAKIISYIQEKRLLTI